MMEAQGVGSKVIADKYGVTIKPTWKIGPQEEIIVSYEQIRSVRWKRATLFARGWLQFTTAGHKATIGSPVFQPGTVVFKRSQQEQMEKLKVFVQEKIDSLRS